VRDESRLCGSYALQRYDVGRLKPVTVYQKRWPEQRPVDGTRIPRLADVFALVKKSGKPRERRSKLSGGALGG
jgi:hypothetical protein